MFPIEREFTYKGYKCKLFHRNNPMLGSQQDLRATAEAPSALEKVCKNRDCFGLFFSPRVKSGQSPEIAVHEMKQKLKKMIDNHLRQGHR
jgi:hypothetical protein